VGYAHIKEVLDAAHAYAETLLASRNPLPRLVVCDQGTSQARFLLARLNPSQTQENTDGQDVGSVIFTDDVSYDVFMDQLRKLTVN
jgi:protein transport protein SEC23